MWIYEICWLQYLVSLVSKATAIIDMLLEIKWNFSLFIKMTSILKNKSIHSWLRANFSSTLTPAHAWKAHSLRKCLVNRQWLILLIILLQILLTLSDDSISHLEFMHIHISVLLHWLVCSWCSNWAAVDWLLWGAVRPLKVKTYQSC